MWPVICVTSKVREPHPTEPDVPIVIFDEIPNKKAHRKPKRFPKGLTPHTT